MTQASTCSAALSTVKPRYGRLRDPPVWQLTARQIRRSGLYGGSLKPSVMRCFVPRVPIEAWRSTEKPPVLKVSTAKWKREKTIMMIPSWLFSNYVVHNGVTRRDTENVALRIDQGWGISSDTYKLEAFAIMSHQTTNYAGQWIENKGNT